MEYKFSFSLLSSLSWSIGCDELCCVRVINWILRRSPSRNARSTMFVVVSSLIRRENLWVSRWKVNYKPTHRGTKLLVASCVACDVVSLGCGNEKEECAHSFAKFKLITLSSVSDQMPSSINPFIRHWEPARFSRSSFDQAHEVHERSRRRKRDINYNHYSPHYGSANVIKFNFYAHDR